MSTYTENEAKAAGLAKALREAGIDAHKHGDQIQIPVEAAARLLVLIESERAMWALNSEPELAADQAAADAQWEQS